MTTTTDTTAQYLDAAAFVAASFRPEQVMRVMTALIDETLDNGEYPAAEEILSLYSRFLPTAVKSDVARELLMLSLAFQEDKEQFIDLTDEDEAYYASFEYVPDPLPAVAIV